MDSSRDTPSSDAPPDDAPSAPSSNAPPSDAVSSNAPPSDAACGDTLWYFAYGSNLHDAIFRQRRGMRARAVRRGWLDGFRLCFNLPVGPGERGVANIEPALGEAICGALYLLSPIDCDRLDRSEGVHVGAYYRLPVDVRLDDGTSCAAFTYRSRFAAAGRKPSPRYLGLLVEGARQRGLPAEYVRWLEGLDLAHDERIGT